LTELMYFPLVFFWTNYIGGKFFRVLALNYLHFMKKLFVVIWKSPVEHVLQLSHHEEHEDHEGRKE